MDKRYETYYEDPMSAAKGQNKRPAASDNCYRNLHLSEVHVESESDLYVNGGGPYERLHLDSNGGDHCTDVYAQLHPAFERETEKQCLTQCFSCKGNATKAVFVTFLMVVVILVIVTMTTTALVFVISLRNNLKAIGEEQNKFKTTVGEELNKIEASLSELNMQVMSNITQLENELESFQPLLYPPSFNVYEHCQKEMGWSTCVNDLSSSSVWTCSSQHLQMNQTGYFALDVRCRYEDNFRGASLSAMFPMYNGDDVYCQCRGVTSQTSNVNYYQYNVSCNVTLIRCPTEVVLQRNAHV